MALIFKQTKLHSSVACVVISFPYQAELSVPTSDETADLSSFKDVQHLELPKVSLL